MCLYCTGKPKEQAIAPQHLQPSVQPWLLRRVFTVPYDTAVVASQRALKGLIDFHAAHQFPEAADEQPGRLALFFFIRMTLIFG